MWGLVLLASRVQSPYTVSNFSPRSCPRPTPGVEPGWMERWCWRRVLFSASSPAVCVSILAQVEPRGFFVHSLPLLTRELEHSTYAQNSGKDFTGVRDGLGVVI